MRVVESKGRVAEFAGAFLKICRYSYMCTWRCSDLNPGRTCGVKVPHYCRGRWRGASTPPWERK